MRYVLPKVLSYNAALARLESIGRRPTKAVYVYGDYVHADLEDSVR